MRKERGRGQVADHPQRHEIEKEALKAQRRMDGAMTLQQVADKYGVTRDLLRYHMRVNMTADRAKELTLEIARDKTAALDAAIDDEQVDINQGLKRIVKEIEEILRRAKDSGDDAFALVSLREMRSTLLDLAKLYGRLNDSVNVNVNIAATPQWAELRQVLIEVFNEHPTALTTFQRKTRHLKLEAPR